MLNITIQHNPHIICLNETKINDEISDELLRIDGFQNIILKDRTRYWGGVAVYVKNYIKFLNEVIWIQISNLFLWNLKSIILSPLLLLF